MTRPSCGPGKVLRAAMVAAVLAGNAAHAADYELLSAVIVSRHGVRSPTNTEPPLAAIAADPWPSWPVAPAFVTPRGEELARLLGTYYRRHYAAQGLLPALGCPGDGEVSVRADVDQRTRVTAQALLQGMFPDCGLAPAYRSDVKVDPLFHPTRAGVCRIDPARARQSVLNRIGGNFTGVTTAYRSEIAAMQLVLKCCAPTLCRAAGTSAPCALGALASTIAGTPEHMRLSGPIAIGSTAAEIFVMEYAQGLPENEVAWGRVPTPEAMRPLLRLHTLQFDLMQRTPYLAARQGSALVRRVLTDLRRSLADRVAGRRPSVPNLVLLVGHDTNLANIGGMLGLHWSLPSYVRDDLPPAGALHFELLRDKEQGSHGVRVSFIAQSPKQMRQVVPLDDLHPPEQAIASIEGCAAADGGTCPWTAFEALAAKALDPACAGAE